MPLYLNTRNPNVKSIKDFTEKDRIACEVADLDHRHVIGQRDGEGRAFLHAHIELPGN